MSIDSIISDFIKVCSLADIKLNKTDIQIEILEAGHGHKPTPLPKEHMAVYIFTSKNGKKCFKVGKVGTNSNARYQSQHYISHSSNSNLAKSLLKDINYNSDIDKRNVGQWIKNNTTRINLVLTKNKGMQTLNLLEAFVQSKFAPKYEGYKTKGHKKSTT